MDPMPGVAVKFAGGAGGADGVTLLEGADPEPAPSAFVAITINVYAVSLVRPVTVIGLAVPVAVIPPGVETTVYPVIGLPPFDGAVKLTVACALPGTAFTAVGAPGRVAGIALLEGLDAALVPTAFVAVTLNV